MVDLGVHSWHSSGPLSGSALRETGTNHFGHPSIWRQSHLGTCPSLSVSLSLSLPLPVPLPLPLPLPVFLSVFVSVFLQVPKEKQRETKGEQGDIWF